MKVTKTILKNAKLLILATIDSDTKGMTEFERKAYEMGVENAFRATKTIAENFPTGRD